jgi:hypothetical protein
MSYTWFFVVLWKKCIRTDHYWVMAFLIGASLLLALFVTFSASAILDALEKTALGLFTFHHEFSKCCTQTLLYTYNTTLYPNASGWSLQSIIWYW